MSQKKIKIRQVRGKAGCTDRQRECLRGLGLRRVGHIVERLDTPAIRGLANAVPHLVVIEEGAK